MQSQREQPERAIPHRIALAVRQVQIITEQVITPDHQAINPLPTIVQAQQVEQTEAQRAVQDDPIVQVLLHQNHHIHQADPLVPEAVLIPRDDHQVPEAVLILQDDHQAARGAAPIRQVALQVAQVVALVEVAHADQVEVVREVPVDHRDQVEVVVAQAGVPDKTSSP